MRRAAIWPGVACSTKMARNGNAARVISEPNSETVWALHSLRKSRFRARVVELKPPDSLRRAWPRRLGIGGRQVEDEGGTLAGLASLQPQRTVHLLREAAADIESQPRTGLLEHTAVGSSRESREDPAYVV